MPFNLRNIMYQIKKIASIAFIILLTTQITNCFAQSKSDYIGRNLNTITTAVPFLMISPDARAGAMGDAGVSSSPDANSMHWNPAKYAFIENNLGFSVAYSPWLKALVDDINLYYVTGYYKLGEQHAIAASLLFFSLGQIEFTDVNAERIATRNPNEFAIDLAYSRKFSPKWSGAVAGRFINSNITQNINVGTSSTKPGRSVAADVAVYYVDDISFPQNNIDGKFSFGLDISNIGTKISYSDDNTRKDFIPTNLRLGPSLLLNLDEFNSLTFMVDFNKLLVPTPPIYETDSNGPVVGPDGNQKILKGKNPDVSVVSGMLQSFYDAPDGFSEEIKEISYSIGVEYWYEKQFAIRGGYFYEDEMKGNRKYFTLGAGLKYNVFGLDFSYLIPTDQKNPLENTLRFTLLFDFAALNKKDKSLK